jgi:hypothetical protein
VDPTGLDLDPTSLDAVLEDEPAGECPVPALGHEEPGLTVHSAG